MRYLLILFLCCLAICGCKKEKEKLPAATQSGKNILACKVNGKVHIYEGKRSNSNDNGVDAGRYLSVNHFVIRVHADNADDYNDNLTMQVFADKPELNKEYIFSKEDSKDGAEYYIGENYVNIYTTKSSSGYIKFSRFDTSVMAGIFMFTAYNDHGAKVEITEGFFDIVPE